MNKLIQDGHRRVGIGALVLGVGPAVYWVASLPSHGIVPIATAIVLPVAAGAIAGSVRVILAAPLSAVWAGLGLLADNRVDGRWWEILLGILFVTALCACMLFLGVILNRRVRRERVVGPPSPI